MSRSSPAIQDLGRRIMTGSAINYFGFFSGKLIVFLNTIVLARLLAPEHFGLVAIGLLILAVSETIAEAGTGAAVVWRRGEVEATAPVAMSVGLIGALAMSCIAVALAPTIARLVDTPEVVPIVRVLALSALLSAPASVFTAILQRRMAFGRRLVPDVAKAIVKGAVGIPLAFWGFGAWSLVYGQIAGVATGLALSWWLSGWKPRLSLDREVVRQVLPYGLQIAALGLLGLAIRRLDVSIIAYRLGPTDLGHYTLAFSFIELSVMGLCWASSQAFFPAFSRLEDRVDEIEPLFTRGLSTLLALTLPLAFGLAVTADPLVRTLYGEKWAPAIPLMQLLAFHAMIYSLGFNLGDLYKASGRPGILTLINLANLVVAAPLLLVMSRWGLTGIALGQVGVAVVITGVNWVVASRVAGLGPMVLVRALRGPLVASVAAAAACVLLDRLVLQTSAAPLRLVVLAATGLAVYALGFAVLNRRQAAALLARVVPRPRRD